MPTWKSFLIIPVILFAGGLYCPASAAENSLRKVYSPVPVAGPLATKICDIVLAKFSEHPGQSALKDGSLEVVALEETFSLRDQEPSLHPALLEVGREMHLARENHAQGVSPFDIHSQYHSLVEMRFGVRGEDREYPVVFTESGGQWQWRPDSPVALDPQLIGATEFSSNVRRISNPTTARRELGQSFMRISEFDFKWELYNLPHSARQYTKMRDSEIQGYISTQMEQPIYYEVRDKADTRTIGYMVTTDLVIRDETQDVDDLYRMHGRDGAIIKDIESKSRYRHYAFFTPDGTRVGAVLPEGSGIPVGRLVDTRTIETGQTVHSDPDQPALRPKSKNETYERGALRPNRQRGGVEINLTPGHFASQSRNAAENVRAWGNPRAGATLLPFDAKTSERLVFSPNGRYVLELTGNGKIHDASTGMPVSDFGGGDAGLLSAAFSGDGTRLYLGYEDGSLREVDPTTGKKRASMNITTPYGDSSRIYAISEQSDRLLVVQGSVNAGDTGIAFVDFQNRKSTMKLLRGRYAGSQTGLVYFETTSGIVAAPLDIRSEKPIGKGSLPSNYLNEGQGLYSGMHYTSRTQTLMVGPSAEFLLAAETSKDRAPQYTVDAVHEPAYVYRFTIDGLEKQARLPGGISMFRAWYKGTGLMEDGRVLVGKVPDDGTPVIWSLIPGAGKMTEIGGLDPTSRPTQFAFQPNRPIFALAESGKVSVWSVVANQAEKIGTVELPTKDPIVQLEFSKDGSALRYLDEQKRVGVVLSGE